MKVQIISTFKEKPKTRTAWWAFGLGVSALITIPLVILFGLSTGPLPIERAGRVNWFGITWGGIFIGLFLLTLAAIISGAIALHKGERSWVLWLGFIPALIIGSFWLFLLVGTIVFGI